jgi:membrane protein DedA with SNARE-associated domain
VGDLLAVISSIQDWAVDLASSPWVLLIIFLGATLDGFFPPAPSEAVLVSAAALGASGEGPHLYYLIPVAALGAFLGDNIGYFLGTKIPLGWSPRHGTSCPAAARPSCSAPASCPSGAWSST